MARWKHKNSSWVSTYDSDLDRWVSWDEMKEDWYREHQARRQFPNLNHPMFWIMESNALHRSALCLWKEGDASPDGPLRLMEYQKVGMMLGRMSIECAIKAQWISKFRFPIDPDQQKKVFSGAHNLV